MGLTGWFQGDLAVAEAKAVCASRALFLSGTSLPVLFLVFFLVTPLSAALNGYLIGLSNPKLSEPAQTASDAPPQTPPPAYAEAPAEDAASSYADVQWAVRGAEAGSQPVAATQFVAGSTAFAALVTALLVLALAIQGLAFCAGAHPALVGFMWAIYGGACMFSVRGLGAWLVLLRNLWGKRGKERFVIRDDIVVRWLFGLVTLPFIAAVGAVWACQRRFCYDGDGGDDDVELGITPSSARFPPASNVPREDGAGGDETKGDEAKGAQPDEALDDRAAEAQGLLAGQEQSGAS